MPRLSVSVGLGCSRRRGLSLFGRRRSVACRFIAHVLWAFLSEVLPATAFADLSVQARIPIAEWRAAMRKERRIELLCVLIPGRPDEGPRESPKRAVPSEPRQLRVSMRAVASRNQPLDGYHCVEKPRRVMRVAWDRDATVPTPWPFSGDAASFSQSIDHSDIPEALQSPTRATGKTRIPIEEWRDAIRGRDRDRFTLTWLLSLTVPIPDSYPRRKERRERSADATLLVREGKERQAQDWALSDPGLITCDKGITLSENRSRCVDRIGHFDAVVSKDLSGEIKDFVRYSDQDDAVRAEHIIESLYTGLIAESDRHDETLSANEPEAEDGSSRRVLDAFNPSNGSHALGRCALNRSFDDAGIEIQPHPYQPSRISRISASISSPVIVPGGKERRYSDSSRVGDSGVYTTTSTLSASGGRGASRWIAPSSMCAGMWWASIAGFPVPLDPTTSLAAGRKTRLVVVILIEVPIPNPSQVANGQQGRGSWHVGAASWSFGPHFDGRLTAEVEASSRSTT